MAQKKKLNPARPLSGSLAYLSATPAYDEMARIWRDKQFGHLRYIDWKVMQALGFKERLEDMLSYTVDGQKFESLKRLFSIDEPVYVEMVTEVMTTFRFQRSQQVGQSSVSFRYLGKSHTLSLAQFALHMGLYTTEEINSPLFLTGATSISVTTTTSEAWSQWSPTPYFSGVKATRLRDPVLQVLHKLISCSLDGKYTTGGRVAAIDVALMESILGKRNIQVAYLVAKRILLEKDFGQRRTYMGAMITRLIRNMGLLRTTDVEKFKSGWSPKPIDYSFLRSMDILRFAKDGTVFIKARATDPKSIETLVPNLILPKQAKKRKRQQKPSDSDTDDEDDDGDEGDDDDIPSPPPVVPPHARAGPSTPAPRPQRPGYICHYGTPPGPDYWYWSMQMQIRIYTALRQQAAGMPMTPLPILPVGMGRAPPHIYPPVVPPPAPRPPPRREHITPPPQIIIPRHQTPQVQVPITRQTVPSSRGSRASRVSARTVTIQSPRTSRRSNPSATAHIPVSSHRQTDLFQNNTHQGSTMFPLDSFEIPSGLPSGLLIDQLVDQGVFTNGTPEEEAIQDASNEGTNDQHDDDSSDETSPAPATSTAAS